MKTGRRLKPAFLLIAALLAHAAIARAAEQTVRLADMDVTVWSESGIKPAKKPVIVFSHGFHGCATQSRFLTEAFASAGYIVFAPNHRDAVCHGGKARLFERPVQPFREPEKWGESTYRDRADDIRRLLAAIKTDDRFRHEADISHCGLAGHSLGGYTVLGLAGAWPSWKIHGIGAVLALSPYSQPFVAHHTLSGLSAPVMYQGGTWDFSITPNVRKSQGAYDHSPEPKYYVEFERATHFAWTDMGFTAHQAIASYGVAFMNRYVKGEPTGPILNQALKGVSALRYAPEQGSEITGGNHQVPGR